MEYFETSAKNNINIQEVIIYIMDKVYENLYSKNTADTEGDDDPGKQSIVLGRKSQQKAGGENGGNGQLDCKC